MNTRAGVYEVDEFAPGRPSAAAAAHAAAEARRHHVLIALRVLVGVAFLGFWEFASGRLIGYVEEHMNPWDCIAGMLLVEEAGGRIVAADPATVLEKGTVVVAGGAGVFDDIKALAGRAFKV